MPLINSENLVEKVDAETKQLVSELGFVPRLGIVLVGENPASLAYVQKKKEKARELGIEAEILSFGKNVSCEEVVETIRKHANDFHGMMVQLPLPSREWNAEVLNAVPAEKDVDCLTDINLGRLMSGDNFITPPTPTSMLMLAEEQVGDLRDKVCTVVGQGILVGKPLTMMLERKGAIVITCNSKTVDLCSETVQADVVFSGVGRANLICAKMVKEGAVVVDAGVSFVDGKAVGDVECEGVACIAKVTPPTNAVGPLTVSLLLKNTAICAGR